MMTFVDVFVAPVKVTIMLFTPVLFNPRPEPRGWNEERY